MRTSCLRFGLCYALIILGFCITFCTIDKSCLSHSYYCRITVEIDVSNITLNTAVFSQFRVESYTSFYY